MHEYSIVQALLNQCEEIALQNSATCVTKVITKIGAMSGVDTHLLESAFDEFKKGTLCDGASFVANYQKIKIKCNECDFEFEIDKTILNKCFKCKSQNIKVIDGEDMFLMRLEMR